MSYSSIEDYLHQYVVDPDARRREFFRYYSPKRVQHQVKQLEILEHATGERLTEIGPFLGYATGLFQAAGFKVQTIDAGDAALLGQVKPVSHISKSILEITSDDLAGQDIVVCCETLEHLEYADAERMLGVFHASGAEWLMISVPYRCLSIDVTIRRNPFGRAFKWLVKFPNRKNRDFTPDPEPYGHKWELGYKSFPLEKLTGSLEATGYDVRKCDYVGSVRSVMILAQRR